MRMTTRSEYALLALLHLARQQNAGYVTAETISEAQGIPRAYLEQILRTLKHSRIVASSRGQHGGFRLARPASKIPLAEVIRLFDGALAPTQSVSKFFYEATPIQKEGKVLAVFKEIRDYVARKLEKTSLADVV